MIGGGLSGRRVVVCCGAGGVGKTTVSAAVALGLARGGARVAVVTIDPARRLADALGLDDLGDDPHRLPDDTLRAAGCPPGAELWALQLDARATFDRLVVRHAPNAEARDRILGNRIYRHLSGTVAGAQEFMAVERLHELSDDDRFEAIVLDTPPSRNALDFLDAPERMIRFVEGRALRLLLRPGSGAGLGWRALHAGGAAVLAVLERVTGAQLLRDISEFLAGFEGMYEGFAERSRRVRELLTSDRAAFVIVTSADAAPLDEAIGLGERLDEDGFPRAGAVLNRVHAAPAAGVVDAGDLESRLAAAGASDPADLARRALRCLEEDRALATRDAAARARLDEALGGAPVVSVPALEDEPVEIAGLSAVTDALGRLDQAEASSSA